MIHMSSLTTHCHMSRSQAEPGLRTEITNLGALKSVGPKVEMWECLDFFFT